GAAQTPAAAGATLRDRSRRSSPDGLFPLRDRLHRRRAPPRACLQLCAGLLPPAIPAFRGVRRLGYDPARTCARLSVLGRSRRHLSLRQLEGRGNGLRRRATDLQPALSRLCHPLRLPALGLSPPPPANERQS